MSIQQNELPSSPAWPELIRKELDFRRGKGILQLDLRHLFSSEDCQNIYKTFNSNLNWIIRDSQKLEIPKNQVPMAEYTWRIMELIRCLLQQNIPEKDHIHLSLETLRVARSDGTQHQVGSRWHQDHEAYFSALINLTENSGSNNSTRFFHLEPNEKYKWDKLGNPVPCEYWRESYVKPFHLGILNSGIRYFLFPYDRCRPISHRAPAPEKNHKRLAIFATFTISGIKQGMDIKDLYVPLINDPKTIEKNAPILKNLQTHWRNLLGIEKSLQTEKTVRRSKTECGIQSMQSIKFSAFCKNPHKKSDNQNQYRIANFGLRQFENDFKNENETILNNAIPIGELSRTLNFFSKIGEFAIKKLIQLNNSSLHITDCSLLANNNYDLLAQFKQPEKPFQLLKMEEILNQIDQIALVLYVGAENYFYPESHCKNYQHSLPFEREIIDGSFTFRKRDFLDKRIAQIFTSPPINEMRLHKTSPFLSYSIKIAQQRGAKILINKKGSKYFKFNGNELNKLLLDLKTSNKYIKDIDEVPFFLSRTGINRTLQKTDLGSNLIQLSKKVLSKGTQ